MNGFAKDQLAPGRKTWSLPQPCIRARGLGFRLYLDPKVAEEWPFTGVCGSYFIFIFIFFFGGGGGGRAAF